VEEDAVDEAKDQLAAAALTLMMDWMKRQNKVTWAALATAAVAWGEPIVEHLVPAVGEVFSEWTGIEASDLPIATKGELAEVSERIDALTGAVCSLVVRTGGSHPACETETEPEEATDPAPEAPEEVP